MKADFDVRYTAGLARIELTGEEADRFQTQLQKVLEYVEKLHEVDVTDVEPTAHANPVYDIVRADQPQESFPATVALSNAPRQANGLFVVPKVLD